MKHDLRISIRRAPSAEGIVRCRTVTLRERLLDRLLGERRQVTVLVPGNSVRRVSITELAEGSEEDEGA